MAGVKKSLSVENPLLWDKVVKKERSLVIEYKKDEIKTNIDKR